MKILFIGLLLFTVQAQADFIQPPAQGFHWYSAEEEDQEEQTILQNQPQMTPYEQLLNLRQNLQNKLAQALIAPSFDATHAYMQAQQQLAKNNQQFVRFWQQVLLMHPELDNTLNYPTDSTAVAIRNDSQELLTQRIISDSAQQYGLILFYRGNSPLSQRFMNVILPFIAENHYSMIPVAVDGNVLPGLEHSKNIPLESVKKIMGLQVNYLPALYLVNLKTQELAPLSYGFLSLSDLKDRFLDVITHYQRYSYEGL